MGLDMYLSKKTYVKNWDHQKPEERHAITVKLGGKKHPTIDPKRISGITEQVAYWRKANAIHQWFVIHAQGGVDECQETPVDRELLQKLLDTVKAVLDDPNMAMTLLPPQSGFFFGSTEVDQWYLEDLKFTRDVLEKELAIDHPKGVWSDYYYQSSW